MYKNIIGQHYSRTEESKIEFACQTTIEPSLEIQKSLLKPLVFM